MHHCALMSKIEMLYVALAWELKIKWRKRWSTTHTYQIVWASTYRCNRYVFAWMRMHMFEGPIHFPFDMMCWTPMRCSSFSQGETPPVMQWKREARGSTVLLHQSPLLGLVAYKTPDEIKIVISHNTTISDEWNASNHGVPTKFCEKGPAPSRISVLGSGVSSCLTLDFEVSLEWNYM